MTITETLPGIEEPAVVAVARLVGLEVPGNDALGRGVVMTRCPFHDDARASLELAPRINRWRCLAGCHGGRWHRPGELYEAVTGKAPDGLVDALGTAGRVETPAGLVGPAERRAEVRALRSVLGFICQRAELLRAGTGVSFSSSVEGWLCSRGFDASVVAPFVYEVDGAVCSVLRARFFDHVLERAGLLVRGRLVFGDRRRVMLVFRDGTGEARWCQFATTEPSVQTRGPKYLGPLGVPPAPFVAGDLAAARRVVVCEGATDALALLHAASGRIPSGALRALVRGRKPLAVIGLPGALNVRREWLCDIVAGTEIVLATDPDDAGDRSAELLEAALRRLGHDRAHISRFRDEGGDLNDLLLAARNP